jgi:hypothetical protein
MFHVSAKLRRKSAAIKTLQVLRRELVADLPHGGEGATRRRGATSTSDFLFEFTPFDLHMGKYTWDEETVTNYDIDIAADLFNASLDYLLGAGAQARRRQARARALRLRERRLPHRQQEGADDGRHADGRRHALHQGLPAHRGRAPRALDVLRQVAPVDVKIVAGNHDELTSFHLGEILAARYEAVTSTSPSTTTRTCGSTTSSARNLLGFSHGDSENVASCR